MMMRKRQGYSLLEAAGILYSIFLAVAHVSIQFAAAQTELISVNELQCDQILTPSDKTIVLHLQGNGTASYFFNYTTEEGADDNGKSEDRRRLLEAIFQSTYNNFSFTACDTPHFRSISSATVDLFGSIEEELESGYYGQNQNTSIPIANSLLHRARPTQHHHRKNISPKRAHKSVSTLQAPSPPHTHCQSPTSTLCTIL